MPGFFLTLTRCPHGKEEETQNCQTMEKVELLRNDAQHKDASCTFTLAQAEKILQNQAKNKRDKVKAYSLPEKSKYEFKDNALKLKSNSKPAAATA